jgi:hypothetical protein
MDPAVTPQVATWLAVAAAGGGRRSRHARTMRADAPGGAWVKAYPAPGARRARNAFRMGRVLAARGFGVPVALLVGWRSGEGVLVTRDVGGEEVRDAVIRAGRMERRALLRALGAEVGRLHEAGIVPGDLVPTNVHVCRGRFVFLDHDRTRRSRLLVRLGGRRNLVQLGRFVVPGVTLADRARVLAGYARARRLSRRARRRLAWWLVGKTTARRCAIDGIAPVAARRAGFRALMRSGGPFDPKPRAT